MRRQHSGLEELTQQEALQALEIQWLARILKLILQDMSEKVEICRDLLGIITDLINFVACSHVV